MSFHAHFDRLHAFLLNLECLDAAGQRDALINECNEAKGHFIPPTRHLQHLWELDLHGIYATGPSEDDAIRTWKKTAHARMPLTDQLPFPNPCNHAEEIANARATARRGVS